jgi:hypothetical protein
VPALTAANIPDGVLLATVVDEIPPRATPAGRRRTRPSKLHTDKAYDRKANRGLAAPTGDCCADRPARSGVINQVGTAALEDRAVTVVVSCYRRLQVRWERDSGRFFPFVLVACALVCFKRL